MKTASATLFALAVFVLVLLALSAPAAQAGPIRNFIANRRAAPPHPACQPAAPRFAAPCCPCVPAPGGAGNHPRPPVVPQLAPACPDGKCPPREAQAADDALDELNAKRADRGLRPYQRDEGLTRAARACATFRASHRLFGHVEGGRGDFAFAEPGVRVDATGCAAYPAGMGFLSCAMWDDYTHAGAVSVPGPDGKAYHHLFVSYGPSATRPAPKKVD